MSNSPYKDFFEKEKNGANNEDIQPSHELNEVDRGEAEIKVEKAKGLDKNKILALIVILISVGVVVVFISLLANKLSGGEEEETVVSENLALAKGETLTLANIQNKIIEEQRKKEEAIQQERERLARLAREKAEREAEQQRLAREAELAALRKQPTAEPATTETTAPTAPPLGSQATLPPHLKREEEKTPEELARERQAQTGVFGYVGSVTASTSQQSTLTRPNSIGNMLITERHADGVARFRGSRKYLLMRGTSIPCTIIPRVITNYISQPTCVVNEDIYSPEGIVLIDRGSKVIGEQRTAMRQGVKRVFIAWADIETPTGVSIKIDSMAADALGGSGINSWIDNHWVERFGAAIMLSFLDDLFEAIATEAGKTEYSFEKSTDNASSMGQIALENSINIEPTGYIMPATQTTIIVARDVDFTAVYTTR